MQIVFNIYKIKTCDDGEMCEFYEAANSIDYIYDTYGNKLVYFELIAKNVIYCMEDKDEQRTDV